MLRAWFSMFPHDEAGSWTPTPRNDSTTSPRMYPGTEIVAATITNENVLGRMCRVMMRNRLTPSASAAVTYSLRRIDSTSPRMTRASPAQPMKARIATMPR